MPILISAAELAEAMPARNLVILDVRWRLDAPDGRPAYREGHVPTAVYVALGTELAAPPSRQEGRHPLPHLADLQAAARRWGIRRDSTVVAYDDIGGMSAARAWWLLRDAGLPDVRLLDGGLAAWRAAGSALETGEVLPEAGDIELSPGHLPVIGLEEAGAFAGTGTLIDARAGERYRGEVEPIDPRAGHIPGAVSVPTAANLGPDGRFLPAEALRRRFLDAGVDAEAPVAAYCGSGVTAAHEVLALTVAGFAPSLYPGSWSQWSSRAGTATATGPSPQGD